MTVLHYANQVKSPRSFEDEVGEPKVSAQEVKLASTLVDGSTAEDFVFSNYHDLYTEPVSKLLEAKMSGKKLEAPHRQKAPAVINLMEALKKSIDRTGAKEKPERAPHVRRHRAPAARRKT